MKLFIIQIWWISVFACIASAKITFKIGSSLAFLEAVQDGNVQKVEELIRGDVEVNAKDSDDWSAFIVAAKSGHVPVMELLLKNGAQINIRGKNSWTALLEATFDGLSDVVKFLVAKGALTNVKTIDGNAALTMAALKGDLKIAEMLLSKIDTDINITNKFGWIPLHTAAYHGHADVVNLLIKRGSDVNHLTSDERSPLYMAADTGNAKAGEVLIQNGADINRQANKQSHLSRTPLFCAAFNGNEQMVKLLIKYHADLDIQDSSGWTPLNTASSRGHFKIAEMLVKAGAMVNRENTYKAMPLFSVAYHGNGNPEIAEMLAKNGANLNYKDANGWTPLIGAVFKHYYYVAEVLLKNGADVNIKNDAGLTALNVATSSGDQDMIGLLNRHIAGVTTKPAKTPARPIQLFEATQKVTSFKDGALKLFLEAAQRGNVEMVEEFIRDGTDVDANQENDDWPALIVAAKSDQVDVMELLLRNGANVNIRGRSGWYSLHEAAFDGLNNVVQFLIAHGGWINDKTSDGFAAIHLAAQNGHKNVMETLLAVNDTDVDNNNKFGWIALHTAAYFGHEEIVDLLLRNGATNNYQSNDGRTPLYMAAEKGHRNAAEILIRNGADVNLKANDGSSPLDIATLNGHQNVVELLNRHNAQKGSSDLTQNNIADVFFGGNWAKTTVSNDVVAAVRPAIKACIEYTTLPIPYILGGELASSGEFPWMAALGYLKIPDFSITYDCGGTLISAFYVMTADHCVRARLPTVVRLGKLKLTDEDGSTAMNYLIQAITRHPNRSSIMKKNDIALIRVARRVEFTAEVLPACLETNLNDRDPSVQLIVTGWGVISAENPISSNELRKTQVKSMPLSECNATLLEFNKRADQPALRNGISESQYCAYDPQGRNDSCQGDSGGPLQYYPTPNSMSHVVGIVSYGLSCGTSLPAVYTRVAFYLDWIESIVWGRK